MADALSQHQIDELFESLNNKDDDDESDVKKKEKRIKNYNFKMPQKFTKEDLKLIRDIYEQYSRLIASYITGITRLYCHAKVLHVEEQKYYEFNNSLEDYVMMGVVGLHFENSDIMDAECTIQFSNAITFSLIDRLMGGPGNAFEISRDFTEIEVSVIRTILEKMAVFLQEAWSGYIEISPTLSRIETNARLTKSIAPDEVIVIATLEIELNKRKSLMTISIPAINMEEIMTNFSQRYTSEASRRVVDDEKRQEQRSSILKGVKSSTLTMTTVLAETQIDLSDILSLRVNDIIPLDVPITQNAKVKINNVQWFTAKPGISNNKKAIKIIDICNNNER
ncbi:MAG: flagellar motor switch protein FliM [Oscillospiraceae bacterium]|nr:flagellar motor switch protein FliM [Oscillospiraceae bacterium]MBR3025106.1 flagellar motor switch protein FliM [Oscillospiraceae bacterium]MBR3534957.1 flagellar motor switch protein FliM [Oscillospiraceae bacterium]MBR6837658.1 flagellar motor switch protein FliM [Oscillospiraceae bacterium]